MSRCTLRNIFTVLIYAGVAIFLYPYVTGHFSGGVIYLVAGIGLAVLCGILRCVCIEGDCPDRIASASRSHHETPTPR
ncbi:MAG TPA: hypothetical protein VGU23_00635 [Acidobacteriaceae bacterium]|nr:hypothetical protein [Acidobacteriaceae bacterium]